MHFYVLKIFFVLSVFVCLKLFFLVFVVLYECIQLFVYAGLLQDRIFDCSFSQLCITIVCLFPRFFNDIRFRMMDAKLFLVILIS